MNIYHDLCVLYCLAVFGLSEAQAYEVWQQTKDDNLTDMFGMILSTVREKGWLTDDELFDVSRGWRSTRPAAGA